MEKGEISADFVNVQKMYGNSDENFAIITLNKVYKKREKTMANTQTGHQPFVVFDNVCKYYQMGDTRIAASDHVSFTIEKGEFCVILGPSGAGKTTVLNMLGGMDTCDEGTILLDGEKVSSFNQKRLTTYRRYDVGFVFQFYNLVQNLTARENVELAAEICRDPLDADTVLEEVGLAHRRNNFPAQLSGGEQQRVSIARALAKNPKILLCDEPTGALDYKTGKQVLALLQDTCRRKGRTVIVITHNSALAAMADRVIRINSGRVIEEKINPNPTPVERIEW
ncbi:ABC transporter, ATP-binding protein [Subdoligranulum variabile DSM 15176]|uniref:ABC transporter, ATP-binding protein n=2 Tax=Subdoligranulum variabile TaxID=214851 RepID=D1PK45_9FIRM|nr:ABC transporter, ATP-binding protein [Subdoligranulum variabile DSM 15176]